MSLNNRKTMVELQTEIAQLFPDNTAALITPAVLRQFLSDFVDSMTPAYGILSTPGPFPITVGVADQLLPWSSEHLAQTPEWETSPATGIIRRTAGQSTVRVSVNLDADIANNREVLATLYVNGSPTSWRQKTIGSGTSRPGIISFEAIHHSDVPVSYSIRLSADMPGTNVVITNGMFVCSVIPVRTA